MHATCGVKPSSLGWIHYTTIITALASNILPCVLLLIVQGILKTAQYLNCGKEVYTPIVSQAMARPNQPQCGSLSVTPVQLSYHTRDPVVRGSS